MKTIKKFIASLLVVIMILSIAPMSEIAKIDFPSIFNSVAYAVSRIINPEFEMGNIKIVSSNRDIRNTNELSTQATGDSVNLTVGDTLTLNIPIYKEDENGNIVEASLDELPALSWSAYPSDAVSLSVGVDPRQCTVVLLSDKYSSVDVTVSMEGGRKTFTINVAKITFDQPKYYILVDDTCLSYDLSSGVSELCKCFAIWSSKQESFSTEGYSFSSSDESILKITGKHCTESEFSKKAYFYPEAYGVSEGEVTLTVTAPDGQKATCDVVVVGYKEYVIESKSDELDIPLADSKLTYNIIRSGMTTQAISASYTDSNGTVTIKIPDAAKCPIELNFEADYHLDKKFSSASLKENEINSVPMKMKEVDVSEVSGGSDSVKGPTINVFGEEISLFDLAVKGELSFGNSKIAVNNIDHTIEILIGLDFEDDTYIGPEGQTTTYWSESYRDVKKLYQEVTGKKVDTTKLWNNFSKLRGKLKKINGSMGIGVSANVAGYIEFSYATGKIQFREGGITASLGADFSMEVKFPPFPIVYGTFGLGLDTTGSICLIHEKDFEMDISGKVELGLSANLGIGAGQKKGAQTYIEGGLQGSLDTELDVSLTSLSSSFTASLTGSLYLKGEALGFDILDTTWPFASVELYPNFGNVTTYATTGTFADAAKKAKPLSRDYLNKNVIYTNSADFDFSKSSIYPYCDPQLFELNNGNKILIWIDDLGDKNAVNKTSIMYSIYDGNSWSAEKAIYEDGTYNGTPVAFCDGDNVYVVWQKANSAMSNSTTMDVLMKNVDLYYSYFNGTKFSVPVRITNSDRLEVSYNVSSYNGQLLVTWLENSENNIFLSSGTTSVNYITIKNGIVSSAQKVYSSTDNISGITSSYYNGKIYIAFTADGDNNSIYLYCNGSVKKIIDNNKNCFVNFVFDKNKLFYLHDNQLYSYDTSRSSTKCYNTTSISNFSIVSNNKCSVILTLVSNGIKCDLYAYDLNNDQTSVIYKLTDFDEYIRNYSAYLDSNNVIQLAANIVDVTNDVNKVYSTSTLAVTSCSEIKDIEIVNYASFDYDKVVAGKNLPISIDVRNNGKTAVNSFTVSVKDESTSITATKTINETINGGETKTVKFDYTLPSTMSKRQFKVEINYNGDSDYTNNTTSFILGEADVELDDFTINNAYTINGIVKNTGYSSASDVIVSVYKMEDDYKLLYEKNIGSVDVNSSKNFSYSVDSSLIKFDSYASNNLFKVCVKTSDTETDYINNEKNLIVLPARVTDISLDKNKLTLVPGSTYQINAIITPENAVTKTVYWFSDDSSIASVDANGIITAHKYGTTTIKAISSDGHFEDYCTVTVSSTVPVDGIKLSSTSENILVGKTLQLTAEISPENASNKNVTWSSSNTSVASVSTSGLVTAKSVGTATITVKTSDGSFSAKCTVNVTNSEIKVTGVNLSSSAISIYVGKTSQLSATINPSNATNKNVKWTSSNKNVATVSSTGLVTAVGKGTAVVTVTTENGGYTASCTINVSEEVIPVSNVSLSKTKLDLEINKSEKLTASISPSNATDKNVVWSSTNSNVASVGQDGTVTAKSSGTATIVATTNDGKKTASCIVNVKSGSSVEKTVKSISVETMPNQTVYYYKLDSFDKSGMSIRVNYSDGSTEIIKDGSKFSVSSIPQKRGDHSLTVDYNGVKTNLNITVKYKWWQWIIKIVLFGWIWY